MAHVPHAVCLTCEVEMAPDKNGAFVKAQTRNDEGTPTDYYIIAADRWRCPLCGTAFIAGFARKPVAEHFQPDSMSKLEPHVEHTFRFRGDMARPGDTAESLQKWRQQIERAIEQKLQELQTLKQHSFAVLERFVDACEQESQASFIPSKEIP